MSVIFDQLRISDDGNLLFINLHVNNASYFNNRYLKSITVIPAKDVLETAPEQPSSKFIYKMDFTENVKDADLVLSRGEFDAAYLNWDVEEESPIDSTKPYASKSFGGSNLSRTLFFVYVECKENTSDPCVPCPLAELHSVGVTFDVNLLYQHVMGFTKGLADTCQVPVGFADFILLWNAFKASIETEHYVPAIKYYNMLFGNAGSFGSLLGVSKPCGCHG